MYIKNKKQKKSQKELQLWRKMQKKPDIFYKFQHVSTISWPTFSLCYFRIFFYAFHNGALNPLLIYYSTNGYYELLDVLYL